MDPPQNAWDFFSLGQAAVCQTLLGILRGRQETLLQLLNRFDEDAGFELSGASQLTELHKF